jgi:hypothetical protein
MHPYISQVRLSACSNNGDRPTESIRTKLGTPALQYILSLSWLILVHVKNKRLRAHKTYTVYFFRPLKQVDKTSYIIILFNSAHFKAHFNVRIYSAIILD